MYDLDHLSTLIINHQSTRVRGRLRKYSEYLEQKLLNLLAVSYLPLLFLEHQELHDLISYTRLAPTTPTIPSRKVIRTRLCQSVIDNQITTLESLALGAKLSLALIVRLRYSSKHLKHL